MALNLFQSFRNQAAARHLFNSDSPIPPHLVESGLRKFCAPPPPHKESSRDKWNSSDGRSDRPTEHPEIPCENFSHITNLLIHLERHRGVQGWSELPRTYTVLRNIGRVDDMRIFVQAGLTDISLPYTLQMLPDEFCDPKARQQFLDFQNYVLTNAKQLETGGGHQHFQGSAGQHFYKLGELGHGGFGYVDKVMSKLSFKIYARKRVLRGRDSPKSRQMQGFFENEIKVLKSISYQHLVKVVGSYTDKECIAYLMEPVARCNLRRYLEELEGHLSETDRVTLRHFYGCLAGTVQYLHQQRVRHRDLKLENILIHDHKLYVADFGAALDWSKKDNSATRDANAPCTHFYMAPELARGETRSSKTDMWSLGVVFLEMTTVLRGMTLQSFRRFLQTQKHNRQPSVFENLGATHAWFNVLSQESRGPQHDNAPITWIHDLIQEDPRNRPSTGWLMRDIRSSRAFHGICCDQQFEDSIHNIDEDEDSDIHREDHETVKLNVADIFDLQNEHPAFEKSNRKVENWLSSTELCLNEVDEELFRTSAPTGHAYDGYLGCHSHSPLEDVSGEHPRYTSPGGYTNQPVPRPPVPQHDQSANGSIHSNFGFIDIEHYIDDDVDSDEDSVVNATSRLDQDSYSTYDVAGDVMDDSSGSESTARPLPQQGTTNTAVSDGMIATQPRSDQGDYARAAETELEALNENVLESVARNDNRALTKPVQDGTSGRPVDCPSPLSECHAPGHAAEEPSKPSKPPPIRAVPTYVDPLPLSLVTTPQTTPVEPSRPPTGFGYPTHGTLNSTAPGKLSVVPLPATSTRPSIEPYPQCENGIQITTPPSPKSEQVPENDPSFAAVKQILKAAKSGRGGELPSTPDTAKVCNAVGSSAKGKAANEAGGVMKKIKGVDVATEKSASKNNATSAGSTEGPNDRAGNINKESNKKTQSQKVAVKAGTARTANGQAANRASDPASNIGKTVTSKETNSPTRVSKAAKGTKVTTPPKTRKANQSSESGLTLENVARVSDGAAVPVVDRPKRDLLNPQNFIQDAWEEASTVATSEMSENTARLFRVPKWILLEQDRVEKYLEYFAKQGKAAAIRCLLEAKCNPGTKKNPRPGPLMITIKGGTLRHIKCMNVLLEGRADVNARDKYSGKTPLHVAIESKNFPGYNKMIRDLIDNGADPNITDNKGDTPLLKILCGSYQPLEKHLLTTLALLLQPKSGADVNGPSGALNNPLHLAVRRNHPMAVGMLLYSKAHINVPNRAGMTPLLLAANQWHQPMSNDQETILELLLDAQFTSQTIDLDVKGGPDGFTALHYAAAAGVETAISMLLAKGSDPHILDNSGRNALQIALPNTAKIPANLHKNVTNMILRAMDPSSPKQTQRSRRP